MPAATTILFLPEDREDGSRTGQLAESGLRTLRTIADRIKAFVTRHNKVLARWARVSRRACGLGAQETSARS